MRMGNWKKGLIISSAVCSRHNFCGQVALKVPRIKVVFLGVLWVHFGDSFVRNSNLTFKLIRVI